MGFLVVPFTLVSVLHKTARATVSTRKSDLVKPCIKPTDSFRKYLWSTDCVLGIAPSAGDTGVNKTQKIPCPHGAYVLMGYIINKNTYATSIEYISA